jgi:hypothetical protein
VPPSLSPKPRSSTPIARRRGRCPAHPHPKLDVAPPGAAATGLLHRAWLPSSTVPDAAAPDSASRSPSPCLTPPELPCFDSIPRQPDTTCSTAPSRHHRQCPTPPAFDPDAAVPDSASRSPPSCLAAPEMPCFNSDPHQPELPPPSSACVLQELRRPPLSRKVPPFSYR